MRFLYLLFAFGLLPSIGFAQNGFAPGAYELTDGTKGEGQIKYSAGSGAELVTKAGEKGKKVTFSPKEVKSFRMDNRNFVSVHDFTINSGMPMSMNIRIKHDFAQLLDTGRVELLDYSFMMSTSRMTSTPGPGGKSETKLSSGTPFSTGCALIRQRGGELTGVPVVPKKARPVIASFIKDRPDLVARLNKEPFTAETVRSVIQAYNAGSK